MAYAPGTGFYADGFGSSQYASLLLLPDAGADPEGVRRLAGVLEAEMDVIHTFGSGARHRPSVRGPQAPSPDTT